MTQPVYSHSLGPLMQIFTADFTVEFDKELQPLGITGRNRKASGDKNNHRKHY